MTEVNHPSDPLSAESAFFRALVERNLDALDKILDDDFRLIDAMAGSEISKAALLEVLAAGQLTFEAIEPAETRVRFYEKTAIVAGSTHMRGRFGQSSFALHSRYTHVFIEQKDQWRLVAAQGTQIAPG